MGGYRLIGALLSCLVMPVAARAESWRGEIRCRVVPTMGTKPLVGPFELELNGTRATFSRPGHNMDSSSLSGIVELGTGEISGTEIKLAGSASARGYSYVSTYHGRIDGGRMQLTGEQVWTAASLPEPFHRGCRVTLSRS
jgi:hypothetical protein